MMIKMKNLNKYYFKGKSGEVHALRDVDLTVEKGEMISISGPSGSGKSTLLHIIAGMDEPTSGEYYFDGRDTTKFTESEKAALRNKYIGIVLQDFGLLPDQNAYVNVSLPLLIAGGRGRIKTLSLEALRAVDMDELAKKRTSLMSGGQKQRVAIARAIVSGAPLLLADEPTGALDSVTAGELMKLFIKLNSEGTTIIIVTHNPEVARICPRRLKMTDGQLEQLP